MVGGSEKVKEAIRGKRVVIERKNGLDFYYFAKLTRGARETVADEKRARWARVATALCCLWAGWGR
eukprot:10033267-Alexandrium_andersonii.AAC.1